MIALKWLSYLPFWALVFLGAMLLLIFQGERDAEELVDAAEALWREWR